MPPRKAAAAKSKAAVTPPAARGRGRPPKPKAVKSREFIDDEADDLVEIMSSEEEIKTVKGRKSSVAVSSLGEDSEGDTEIVEPETPTHKSRRVATATPSATKTTLSKKKAASDWASDSDDGGDIEMSESPKKNRLTPAQKVRFTNIAKSIEPIKKEAKVDLAVVISTKSKSAVKKPEASDESEGDVFKAPSIKVPVEFNKKRVRSPVKYDSDDGEPVSGFEGDSPKERKKLKVVAAKKGLKDSDEEQEDIKVRVAKNKAKAAPGWDADDEEVYLEDYVTSETPPDVDESNANNRDKHLLRTYEGLTNVKAAMIYSWSTTSGPGNPTYTEVLARCASINRKLLLSAVVFDRQSGLQFMNLSRTDPAKISTGSNGKKHFHSLQSDQPLVFTSVIVVDQCYLEDGKATSTGKLQKILKGMLLEGEFERFVGNIGMIIRSREFGAQIYKDILDFSTYMDGNASLSSSPFKGGGRSAMASTSGQAGPFVFRGSPSTANGRSIRKLCLSSKDIIPIYDCRDVQDNFDHILANLKDVPRYNNDLPSGSCVVVGYTANTFTKKDADMPSVAFNIHWVILLALPGKGKSPGN